MIFESSYTNKKNYALLQIKNVFYCGSIQTLYGI